MQSQSSASRTVKSHTGLFPTNRLHWAQIALCSIALVSAHHVQAQVQSEARTSTQLQTCGSSCYPAPLFAAQESLWMSHGDSASPTSTFGYYPTPNGPTQSVYANADLAASQLHVSLSGQADQTNQRLFGWVNAAIGDTLQINGNGTSRLSVDLSGSINTSNNPSDFFASVTLYLLAPGSLDAFSRRDYANYRILDSANLATGGSDWGNPQSLQLPSTLDLQFTTPESSFEWSVQFFGTYTLTGSQAVNMDLGHTLTVHLDAPNGAELISASGYVPSGTGWVAPPAVPEPQTWALWLGGLAALGAWARRRQAQCA